MFAPYYEEISHLLVMRDGGTLWWPEFMVEGDIDIFDLITHLPEAVARVRT